MILTVLGVMVGVVAVILVSMALNRLSRSKNPRMFQFGKFEGVRDGLKNHTNFDDEPNRVTYVDYRYWVRLSPNPGFNLPVIGYWSKHRGRRR